MKYSQLIGIIAAVAVIIVCHLPWTFIESKNLTIYGMHAPDTNFGRPGLMNFIVSGLSIIFFAIPRIWAKRTNVFVTVFNLAWSIRNFILLASCLMGECPVKKTSLYLLIAFSAVMMLMALLPKLAIKPKT
jgi:uncharacterized membrane protein YuzA (DUF378 family)